MDLELAEATVETVSAALRDGRVTALELAREYLARIEEIDPALGSVLAVSPAAETEAAALDEELAAGRSRGPLHGIPILVKDNIDTAGIPTTAGSLALAAADPPPDAPLVARLREAGALIVGKANLSEWANIRSSRSTSGWSAVGGQCRNPYALDRNPCGSSSGSGAAASANLAVATVGTETDGSIVCPSSINGIVGIKPTVGLVSRTGVVPISHTQDTAGPMTRTVADAAALLAVMAGPDDADPGSRSAPPGWDPLAGLGSTDLGGIRVGVGRDLAGFHPGVDARFEDALTVIRDLGAEVVDPVEVAHLSELEEPETEVLLVELRNDLARYLAGVSGDVPRTLADVIAFNLANADRELAVFGQERFEDAVEKGSLEEPSYLEALATCRRLTRDEGLDPVFAKVDVLVAPTSGPAWLTDHVNGDHYIGGNSAPAAISGYPSLTLPMGSVSGLPVGLSIMGPAFAEPLLVRCGAAFERATGHRAQPRLLATVGDR